VIAVGAATTDAKIEIQLCVGLQGQSGHTRVTRALGSLRSIRSLGSIRSIRSLGSLVS
jgi:hypothetical protein